jgi:hypothetical protein
VTGKVLALDRAWEAFRASSGLIAHSFNPHSAQRIRARRLLVIAEIGTYHARNIALLTNAPGAATPEPRDESGGQPTTKPCNARAARRIPGTRPDVPRHTAISALALEPGLAKAPVPASERIAHHAEQLAAATATLTRALEAC